MKHAQKRYFTILLFSFLAISLYQNCSDVGFTEVVGDLGGPEEPIDPLACHIGSPGGVNTYPSPCLRKPSFLNSSSIGFQLSGTQMSKFSLTANDSINGISEDTFLYIEVSTYSHPDSFVITYDTVSSTAQPLFNVCHISTWNQSWLPAFQTQRPYSTTIVQFGRFGNDPNYWIKIPRGTKKLHFNFKEIISASYIAVYNLNAFSRNLQSIQNPDAWRNYVQRDPADAPLPGERPDCYPYGNNIGSYNCFSPGNFMYQASPPTRYNDAPGVSADPNQMLCSE